MRRNARDAFGDEDDAGACEEVAECTAHGRRLVVSVQGDLGVGVGCGGRWRPVVGGG